MRGPVAAGARLNTSLPSIFASVGVQVHHSIPADFRLGSKAEPVSIRLTCKIACIDAAKRVAYPERFALPGFWFVVGKAGNPRALQVSHLQAAPASKLLPQLVHKSVHTLAGFMKRVHKRAMKRSPARSLGARLRPRLRMRS